MALSMLVIITRFYAGWMRTRARSTFRVYLFGHVVFNSKHDSSSSSSSSSSVLGDARRATKVESVEPQADGRRADGREIRVQ